MEEDRAIRLYVSGKITEEQWDLQREFTTERLESLRARVDDYHAREASEARKRELAEVVLAWARVVDQGLDELPPGQRKEVLQMVVDEVTVDRENNLDITLAIPIDDEPVAIASQPSPRGGEAGGHPKEAPIRGRHRRGASRGSPLQGGASGSEAGALRWGLVAVTGPLTSVLSRGEWR